MEIVDRFSHPCSDPLRSWIEGSSSRRRLLRVYNVNPWLCKPDSLDSSLWINLHGSIDLPLACTSCRRKSRFTLVKWGAHVRHCALHRVQVEQPPCCAFCQGMLRPCLLWHNEWTVDSDMYSQLFMDVHNADGLLILGMPQDGGVQDQQQWRLSPIFHVLHGCRDATPSVPRVWITSYSRECIPAQLTEPDQGCDMTELMPLRSAGFTRVKDVILAGDAVDEHLRRGLACLMHAAHLDVPQRMLPGVVTLSSASDFAHHVTTTDQIVNRLAADVQQALAIDVRANSPSPSPWVSSAQGRVWQDFQEVLEGFRLECIELQVVFDFASVMSLMNADLVASTTPLLHHLPASAYDEQRKVKPEYVKQLDLGFDLAMMYVMRFRRAISEDCGEIPIFVLLWEWLVLRVIRYNPPSVLQMKQLLGQRIIDRTFLSPTDPIFIRLLDQNLSRYTDLYDSMRVRHTWVQQLSPESRLFVSEMDYLAMFIVLSIFNSTNV
jgi:hypothetical protein